LLSLSKTKSSPIMVAVKRCHRCRLVMWHGHPANQINHQSLSSIPLLGFRFSRFISHPPNASAPVCVVHRHGHLVGPHKTKTVVCHGSTPVVHLLFSSRCCQSSSPLTSIQLQSTQSIQHMGCEAVFAKLTGSLLRYSQKQ
jgi:hypothetical protein